MPLQVKDLVIINTTIINCFITDGIGITHGANALLSDAGANPWGAVGNALGKGNKEHKTRLCCSMYIHQMKNFVISWALKSVTLRLEIHTAAIENTWLSNN